jgi:hypothetical protein
LKSIALQIFETHFLSIQHIKLINGITN